jgi:hypothetical protein
MFRAHRSWSSATPSFPWWHCVGAPRRRLLERGAPPLHSGAAHTGAAPCSTRFPPWSTNCRAWGGNGPPAFPPAAVPRSAQRLQRARRGRACAGDRGRPGSRRPPDSAHPPATASGARSRAWSGARCPPPGAPPPAVHRGCRAAACLRVGPHNRHARAVLGARAGALAAPPAVAGSIRHHRPAVAQAQRAPHPTPAQPPSRRPPPPGLLADPTAVATTGEVRFVEPPPPRVFGAGGCPLQRANTSGEQVPRPVRTPVGGQAARFRTPARFPTRGGAPRRLPPSPHRGAHQPP